jgi:hypothetical protein
MLTAKDAYEISKNSKSNESKCWLTKEMKSLSQIIHIISISGDFVFRKVYHNNNITEENIKEIGNVLTKYGYKVNVTRTFNMFYLTITWDHFRNQET